MNWDNHISEITRLRREADRLNDDNPGSVLVKVELLSRCLTYIGRLSSHFDGYHKRVYNRRKLDYAKAYKAAKSHKAVEAEISIAELRDLEADAYEQRMRWRNAFESTQEEIHALKLRHRQDMQLENTSNTLNNQDRHKAVY